VAALAGIEVRRCGKLSRVAIGVAVGATRELDFEKRVFAFGNVALVAFQARMPALEWI